jgi:hypothetical protein
VAKPASVEASLLVIFTQFIFNLEEANISKTGCRWLGKANWNQFSHIYLSIILIIEVPITLVGRVADI